MAARSAGTRARGSGVIWPAHSRVSYAVVAMDECFYCGPSWNVLEPPTNGSGRDLPMLGIDVGPHLANSDSVTFSAAVGARGSTTKVIRRHPRCGGDVVSSSCTSRTASA